MGDEVNALLTCSNTEIVQMRRGYLPRYYHSRSNASKLVPIMEPVSRDSGLAILEI